mgnify:CR=1 FL=1
MQDENFYVQLKKFFKDLGLTQRQIADKLGVKQSYVNLMLNGRNPIGRHNAQKFHDAYGLSVAWLLTGEGDMMARGAAVNIDARDNRGNTITAAGGSSVAGHGRRRGHRGQNAGANRQTDRPKSEANRPPGREHKEQPAVTRVNSPGGSAKRIKPRQKVQPHCTNPSVDFQYPNYKSVTRIQIITKHNHNTFAYEHRNYRSNGQRTRTA